MFYKKNVIVQIVGAKKPQPNVSTDSNYSEIYTLNVYI